MVLATQLLAKGNIEVKVSDGSLAVTDSVAVSTNDGAWGTAGPIEGNGDFDLLQIAIAANGDAIAIWRQYDGMRYNVWANRYVASTGWETAGPIENTNENTNESSYDPQIAVDANGNAIAVWAQSDGTCCRSNIGANRYTVGVGWGTAGLIEMGTGHSESAKITMGANGDAIVVWTRYDDATGNNVWANRYTVGVGWGTAAPIETDGQENDSPQIAMAAGGDAVVVWTQWNGSLDNIWANEFK